MIQTSDFHLTKFGLTPAIPRVGVESNSMYTRSQVNKNRVNVRIRSENTVKRVGTSAIPSFNLLRILFYLRASLHRVCIAFFSSLRREIGGASTLQVLCKYEETYKRVKSRLKESPNQVASVTAVQNDTLAQYQGAMARQFAKVLQSIIQAGNMYLLCRCDVPYKSYIITPLYPDNTYVILT